MKHLSLLKSFLLLCALIAGSSSVWADKITDYNNIVSGKKYYIGATTGNKDYYLSLASTSTGTGIVGTAKTSKDDANIFVFTKSGTNWAIQIDGTSNYISLASSKANGKVNVVSSSANWTASNNTSKSLIRLAVGNFSLQKNNSGTQFGSYANSQTDIWLEEVLADNDLTITSETTVNLTITTETPNPTSTVTWTTSSDGALTWTTNNSSVATVANGVITAVGAGSTTITVSQAATSSYAASETKTITVNVTDARKSACDIALTGAPIALSFDLYNNNSAQVINYTTSSTGAVTVESSEYISAVVNTEAKTITVTPTKQTPSAQTITVSQASDASYNAGTVTFTVSIDDSTPLTEETITISELGVTDNGTEMSTINGEAVTITWSKGSNTNAPKFYDGGNETRFYKGNTIAFTSTDKTIGQIEFTYSPGYDGSNFTTSVGTMSDGVWTGAAKEVTLTNGASDNTQIRFTAIKVTYIEVATVTITTAEYATFCSTSALDFSDVDDVTAYTASLSGSTVTFNKVTGSVPAGTGLLLKGAADTYNIPVVASSTTDVSGNKLVGVTAATEIDGTSGNFFVLKKVGENVGFYKVNNAAYTVRANTAYLNAEGAGAKDFIGFDDDETTAIDNLTISQFVKNAPVYNLAGQKVSNSYKGIVIVNGKKYINK